MICALIFGKNARGKNLEAHYRIPIADQASPNFALSPESQVPYQECEQSDHPDRPHGKPADKSAASERAVLTDKSKKKPVKKKTASKVKATLEENSGSKSKKTAAKKKAVAKKAVAKKTSAKKTAAKASAKKKTAATKSTDQVVSESPVAKVSSKKSSGKKAAAKKKPAKNAALANEADSTDIDSEEDFDVNNLPSPGAQPAVVPYERGSGHYMDPEQLQHFSKKLADWKQQLMEEVDRTVGHMKDDATNFPDPNDRATQEEEFSLELRTRDRERKLIKKINEAQKRIDDDEYGYCETCGIEIGVNRLEARPTAELCIDCKTLEEIRERQTA